MKVPRLLEEVDPALVRAACEGDALAVDKLLDELLPMVRRLSHAVAPAYAEDATQEALILVFRNLRTLRNPEAIVAWTRKLTLRAALRLARGSIPQLQLDAAAEIDRHGSDEHLIDLADSLRTLSAEQRTIVALRTIEGLTEREVADTLGLPLGTVKSRLHRARAKLRGDWSS